MRSVLQFLVRVTSFLQKEIFAILRQPRLIFTLILGPFLILLIFGLGFESTQIPMETLFVVPEESNLRPLVEEHGDTLVKQLVPVGVTADRLSAMDRLRQGHVDLVVIAPSKTTELVERNQQARFEIYHNHIDPIQTSYIQSFSATFNQSFNHRLLLYLTRKVQDEVPALDAQIDSMRQTFAEMQQAFEQGNLSKLDAQRRQLQEEVEVLAATLGVYDLLITSLRDMTGQDELLDRTEPVDMSRDLRESLQALESAQDGTRSEVEAHLDAIEQSLATMDATLSQLASMEPVVLINPFTTETTGLSSENLGVTDYYAPSVLVLLVQHLSITFAGLSIVQDRRLGIMELFQASPLSSFEMLLGKYVSYLIFAGLLLVILTLGLVHGLEVPVRGRWFDLVLANGLLVFASLGMGFVISLLAETTSQAVQYAMIVLLASVFFTGFFLSLDLMADWIQVISWLLPATYGVQWLQEIMLRGMAPDPLLLWGLGGFGVTLFVVAWILLRRLMARQ